MLKRQQSFSTVDSMRNKGKTSTKPATPRRRDDDFMGAGPSAGSSTTTSAFTSPKKEEPVKQKQMRKIEMKPPPKEKKKQKKKNTGPFACCMAESSSDEDEVETTGTDGTVLHHDEETDVVIIGEADDCEDAPAARPQPVHGEQALPGAVDDDSPAKNSKICAVASFRRLSETAVSRPLLDNSSAPAPQPKVVGRSATNRPPSAGGRRPTSATGSPSASADGVPPDGNPLRRLSSLGSMRALNASSSGAGQSAPASPSAPEGIRRKPSMQSMLSGSQSGPSSPAAPSSSSPNETQSPIRRKDSGIFRSSERPLPMARKSSTSNPGMLPPGQKKGKSRIIGNSSSDAGFDVSGTGSTGSPTAFAPINADMTSPMQSRSVVNFDEE